MHPQLLLLTYNTLQPKPPPEPPTATMGKAVKQTGAGSTTAPRQSLAATHPSNYVKSASTKMPPPPAPTLARQTPGSETAKTKSSSATSITHPYPTPTPSPPEKLLDNFATPTTGKRVSTALRACPAPAGRPLLAQIHPAQTGGGEQRGIGRPWEQHNDPTVRTESSHVKGVKLIRA